MDLKIVVESWTFTEVTERRLIALKILWTANIKNIEIMRRMREDHIIYTIKKKKLALTWRMLWKI